MYQRVIYMSRRDVERINSGDVPLISITSPPDGDWSRPAKLAACWGKILRLEFHDDEHPHIYPDGTTLVLMSDEQGYQILRFLRENESYNELVVHCEGGISRSAAIARFVSDYYGIPYQTVVNGILYQNPIMEKYNRSMYAKLVKLYGLCLSEKGEIPRGELPALQAFENYMKEKVDGQEG